MQRNCDLCGTVYEALRTTSKYCSANCRMRKSRGATAPKKVTKRKANRVTKSDPAQITSLPPPDESPTGPIESALLAELTAVDRVSTTLGQAALALARRVDLGHDTGAGLASLVKQLEATKNSATANVKSDRSPLDIRRDELAERRGRQGA